MARSSPAARSIRSGRMDFELETDRGRVAHIEAVANEDIAANDPVAVLPRAEAFAIPDLIRTKINLLPDAITDVRIVEIVGLDLQADGDARCQHRRDRRTAGDRDTSKGRINKRIRIVVAD